MANVFGLGYRDDDAIIGPTTVDECKKACNERASPPHNLCWGFFFHKDDQICVLYDIYDDPYHIDRNKATHFETDTYLRRCPFICKFNLMTISTFMHKGFIIGLKWLLPKLSLR